MRRRRTHQRPVRAWRLHLVHRLVPSHGRACGSWPHPDHRSAIVETLYRYGHALDYGDVEAWLECFAPSAAFEIRRRGVQVARHEGPASLREFARRHTSAPDDHHKHLVLAPLIDLDGTRASVTSYFARLDDEPDGPRVHGFGRYLDDLVLSADGRWRFVERVVDVESFDEGGRPGSWEVGVEPAGPGEPGDAERRSGVRR